MDELASIALEEIALEGRAGCGAPRLWELVESRLPAAGVTQLSAPLQKLLWSSLRQRPQDLQLLVKTDDEEAQLLAGNQPKANQGGKAKQRQKKIVDPTAGMRLASQDEVDTWQQAGTQDVVLMASDAVRTAVLGLYDSSTCRFTLSEPQLATLEEVARARTLGVLQSVLAPVMNITNQNFFYVTKCLEERGLISRTPVVVTGIVRTGSSTITTNVLHLHRYAPAVRLGPHQVFKILDPQEGERHLDADAATYTLQDDSRQMRVICERISKTEDKTVLEFELKLVMGYLGKKGHRSWRRIKQKLVKAGFISVFPANINGRAVVCIKLLKESKPPGAESDDFEAAEDGASNPAGLTEVSVERQMLELVLASDTQGILNTTLFETVGLNSKRHGTMLVDMVRKYGLQVSVVSVGKALHNRVVASPQLVLQYRRAQAAALEGGPSDNHQAPLLLPSQEGGPELLPAAGTGPLTLVPAAVTLAPPAMNKRHVHLPMTHFIPDKHNPVQGTGTTFRPQKVTTELSNDRLRRLLARVEAQGYVISQEIRSMLHMYEVEHGLLPPSTNINFKGPDRKSVERLTRRLEESGKARRVTLALPGSYTRGEPRMVVVLVAARLKLDTELERAICAYFAGFERNIRQMGSSLYFAALRDVVAEKSDEETPPAAGAAEEAAEGPPVLGNEPAFDETTSGVVSAALSLKSLPHMMHLEGLAGGKVVAAPPLRRSTYGLSTREKYSLAMTEARRPNPVGLGRTPPAFLEHMRVPSMPLATLGPSQAPGRVSRLLPGLPINRGRHGPFAEGERCAPPLVLGTDMDNAGLKPRRGLKAVLGLRTIQVVPGHALSFADQSSVLSGQAFSGEGAISRLHRNGFNWARLARVRLLHYAMCRTLGLGGFPPVAEGQRANLHRGRDLYGTSLRAALGLPKAGSCTAPQEPGSTPHMTQQSAGLELGHPPEGSMDLKYSMSTQALWASLPLVQALQIAGSSLAMGIPELLKLCESNERIGDFTPEQQAAIFDPHYKVRFAACVDVLRRLELLDNCVSPGNSAGVVAPHTILAMHTKGVMDDPGSQRQTAASAAAAIVTSAALAMEGPQSGQGKGATPRKRPRLAQSAAEGAVEGAGPAVEGVQPAVEGAELAVVSAQPGAEGAELAVASGSMEGLELALVGSAQATDPAPAPTAPKPKQKRRPRGSGRGPRKRSAAALVALAARAAAQAAAPHGKKKKRRSQAKGLRRESAFSRVVEGSDSGEGEGEQGRALVAVPGTKSERRPVRVTFNLETAEGLDGYWSRIEHIFTMGTDGLALLKKCWPATSAPEVLSTSGWSNTRTQVDTLVWLQMAERVEEVCTAALANGKEPDEKELREVATDLNVPYSLVNKLVDTMVRRHLSALGIRGKEAQRLVRGSKKNRANGAKLGRPKGSRTHRYTGLTTEEAERLAIKKRRRRESRGETIVIQRRLIKEARVVARWKRGTSKSQALHEQLTQQEVAAEGAEARAWDRVQVAKRQCDGAGGQERQHQSLKLQQLTLDAQILSQSLVQLREQLTRNSQKMQALIEERAHIPGLNPVRGTEGAEGAGVALPLPVALIPHPGSRRKRRRLGERKSLAKPKGQSSGESSSSGLGSSSDSDSDGSSMSESGEGGDAGAHIDDDALQECANLVTLAVPERSGRDITNKSGQPRTRTTPDIDRAMLLAWVNFRVARGMGYTSAKGRIPWAEVQGLPCSAKAAYNRLMLQKRKHPEEMDRVVRALQAAHQKLDAARKVLKQQQRAEFLKQRALTRQAAETGDQLAADENMETDQQLDALMEAAQQAEAAQTAEATEQVKAAQQPGVAQQVEAAQQVAEGSGSLQAAGAEAGGEPEQEASAELQSLVQMQAELVHEVMTGPVELLLSKVVYILPKHLGPNKEKLHPSLDSSSGEEEEEGQEGEQEGQAGPDQVQPAMEGLGSKGGTASKPVHKLLSLARGKVHGPMGLLTCKAASYTAKLQLLFTNPSELLHPLKLNQALAPGAQCALAILKSQLLLLDQTGGNTAAAVESLSRRFSLVELQAAMSKLRTSGWLAGAAGPHALQLSPAFHAHLAGEAVLPGARQLLAGSDALCNVLELGLGKAVALSSPLHHLAEQDLEGALTACTATVRVALPLLCPDLLSPAAPHSGPPPLYYTQPAIVPEDAAAGGQPEVAQQGQQGQQGQPQGQGAPKNQVVLQLACNPPTPLEEQPKVPSDLIIALLPSLMHGGVHLGVGGVEPVPARAQAWYTLPAAVLITLTRTPNTDPVRGAVGEQRGAGAAGTAAAAQQRAATVEQEEQQPTDMQVDTNPSDLAGHSPHLVATADTRVTAGLAHALLADCVHLLDLPAASSWLLSEFAPHNVATDEALRQAAESACVAHVTAADSARATRDGAQGVQQGVEAGAQGPADEPEAADGGVHHGSVAAEVTAALLRLLRGLSGTGATLTTACEAMAAAPAPELARWNGQPGASRLVCVCTAAAALLRHGLVRVAHGHDDGRLIACEFSQHLVALPPASGVPASGTRSRVVTGKGQAAGAGTHMGGLTGQGRAGGAETEEVLLAPWHDVHGRLNQALLRGLTRSALLATEQAPGAPEALLVALLHMVPPVHARGLLRAMARQGILVQTSLPVAEVVAPRRPSLLRGMGRPSTPQGQEQGGAGSLAVIPQLLHYYSPGSGSALGIQTGVRHLSMPCVTGGDGVQ